MIRIKEELAFLDIETTGLRPEFHEVIEVCVLHGSEVYCVKITPQNIGSADPEALEMNGYNHKDWANSLSPSVAAKDLSELLKDKRIVAHNPSFDMEFLAELCNTYGYPLNCRYRYIDTTVLAHEHLSPCGLHGLSLDSIRKFLGWPIENSHRAYKDAKDVRQLYYRLSRATVWDRFVWTYFRKVLTFFGLRK